MFANIPLSNNETSRYKVYDHLYNRIDLTSDLTISMAFDRMKYLLPLVTVFDAENQRSLRRLVITFTHDEFEIVRLRASKTCQYTTSILYCFCYGYPFTPFVTFVTFPTTLAVNRTTYNIHHTPSLLTITHTHLLYTTDGQKRPETKETHPALRGFELEYRWENVAEEDFALGVIFMFWSVIIGFIVLFITIFYYTEDTEIIRYGGLTADRLS